jgi:type I restriction enzyme, S subunit
MSKNPNRRILILNSEWKEVQLQDVVTKLGDGLHGTPKYKENGEYFFVNGNNLVNGKVVFNKQTKRADKSEYLKYQKNLTNRTIFVSINGTLGNVALYNGEKIILGKSACYFNVKEDVDKYFIKYVLTNNYFKDFITNLATGTTIKNVSLKTMREFPFNLPPLPEQKRIAEILSSLDDKIELNNKMNKNLEEMAQAIFKQWFVDFEFPDENDNPYKSTGGKMIQSELGEIPEGWSVGMLGEIINLYDSKRVPLSSRERESRKGIYPYYGATSIMDYIDDYLFEGTYLLMGEDGTVADENDYPILQYVWGKFWVNNHAHILQGNDKFTTEYLYLLLKKTNVSAIITGAVQKKINQGNMNSLKVFIPQEDILENFNIVVKEIFMKYKENTEEIRTLTKTRDSLLPKLMNGEIRV